MNLLFIDCEIANKHNVQPKIAQFGYVLADESLNVIEEDNFFINPGDGEDFANIIERNLEVDHSENDYEFYRRQNKFPYYYEKIKSLLEDSNNQVIGWAINNDLFYISSECKRYKLNDINVKAFDVQTFYRIVKEKCGVPSMGNAIKNLFSKEDEINDIKEHNSKNDSFLGLKVFKKVCEDKGLNINECLNDNSLSICYVNSDNCFKKEYIDLKAKQVKKSILNDINWNNVNRYVFFDIECANCFNDEGKICEFGWVVIPSNFGRLNRGEYLINPGNGRNNRFALLGRKGQDDLHLRYEANNYEAYRTAPEFDNFISNIDFLLNQKDILIFGFNVLNDFDYLDYSYRRYKYKPLNIFAIDVQVLYKKLLNDNGGLEYIIKKYLSEEAKNIIFHSSSYDAEATMLALKYLLNKFGVTLEELIKQVGPECIVSSKWDVEVTKTNADKRNLRKQIIANKIASKKPFDLLRSERKKDKKYKVNLSEPEFIGKRFTFSNKIQKSDINLVDLCEKIEAKGYLLGLETKDIDIFICKDEEECSSLREKIMHESKFVKINDFLAELGISNQFN